METLFIVMPAYNEEANIENVIKQWYPKLACKSDDSRMVIADKGSTDRTHEILLKMINNGYDKLEVIDSVEKYHGPKVIALYKYAIAKNADYVFQTDSDGQTNPDEFDVFWEDRKNYSAIFGTRPSREDGLMRKFVERVVCVILKVIFGVSVSDANAPFRLFEVKQLSNYIKRIPDDFNLPNIILTMFYVYYSEKCSFIPISFRPRQGGKNSMNIAKIIKIGSKAVRDFNEIKREML